ncbi:succinyldiaminopimelate transaminase [Cocleimonas flava]|uniref:Succinyldiaminopimelate aminotransferase n=1 Tax=Cocleimonas flava TaxID=634765 RepID=A0A4R1F564_9GAMM|nr:succinyldiaminopimelate transaminase [Cocleimonas flava]TCJ86898.1 succinyldiaminopimelate aminotransferase [Cocleimonas flava]
MNPNLNQLHPYPFQKIAELYQGVEPATKDLISFAIGEPKHKTPDIILEAVQQNLSGFSNYPLTAGSPELRESIKHWLIQRFNLGQSNITEDKNILPVNGTREALFAFAQAVVDNTKPNASILMPNPFYQIYEGAAFLSGAKPVFLSCTKETNFSPDFSKVTPAQWDDCQLLYLCSPGNPTGSVVDAEQIVQLIELAEKHDFIIASDECYSEIYFDEEKPPVGLLEVAATMGNLDFKRCVVFHSLSKRSNAPGLRSGFVAGDAEILKKFLLFRTYHGCAMSQPIQMASIAAWNDEKHVKENRDQYRLKFDAVLDVLGDVLEVDKPEAGFYLWPDVQMNDEIFTRDVYAQQNLKVVPGSYLARSVDGVNPGENRIRMALVATIEECIEGAERLRAFIKSQ